jgi:predicted nucleic acid-binding protein
LISDAVQDFEWIPIDESIWYAVGNNLNILRRNGLNVPFQDAVLTILCIEQDIYIATKDNHFQKF